ncbi:MAG: hypothetical protein JSR77_03760 [Planctomycetes bacterium]|nr:hypothetical protein [Planctomycetota bacterium]
MQTLKWYQQPVMLNGRITWNYSILATRLQIEVAEDSIRIVEIGHASFYSYLPSAVIGIALPYAVSVVSGSGFSAFASDPWFATVCTVSGALFFLAAFIARTCRRVVTFMPNERAVFFESRVAGFRQVRKRHISQGYPMVMVHPVLLNQQGSILPSWRGFALFCHYGEKETTVMAVAKSRDQIDQELRNSPGLSQWFVADLGGLIMADA